MNLLPEESVVLITSCNSDNGRFGTGFVVSKAKGASYVLTCAHVIREVGGSEEVLVEGMTGIVVTSGETEGLDLAILRVDGLWDRSSFRLKPAPGQQGDCFLTIGFQQYAKNHLRRRLSGQLNNLVELRSQGSGRVKAWDLEITDNYSLQPGYSGSPVIDATSMEVIGVVSHRQGEGRSGLGISIEALQKIWQVLDSEKFYRNLLKLGYREQVRRFRRLIQSNSIAAFLIHGYPEYGQRWLLNRLVKQYIPYILAGKIIRIDLGRKVKRNDIDAVWRELARRVGLRNHADPSLVAERVYQWWLTQNVLLVFHDVDCVPQALFHDLVHQFWTPLAKMAQEADIANPYKLLMFLIDYEGCVEKWSQALLDYAHAIPSAETLIRSPRITPFTNNDLANWLEDELEELPTELTQEIESTIQEILESSGGGIPELVLEEICDRCGWDWFEESEKWLKL